MLKGKVVAGSLMHYNQKSYILHKMLNLRFNFSQDCRDWCDCNSDISNGIDNRDI